MKIKIPVHATWAKIKPNGSFYIILKEVDKNGTVLIERLFAKKKGWEERNHKEFYLQMELDLHYQKRTFKQNASIWVLITAIFVSMEGRVPDEEEKYSLYLDLLEIYADKVQTRFGKIRPVHISESNSMEGARFIDGLLYHLATICDLDFDTQATVIAIMQSWETWRGNLDIDPVDYLHLDCTEMVSLDVWREKHPYSEASGCGGDIVRAHIVSRGSDAQDIEKAWNWIALLRDEHQKQHAIGWDEFLQIYPHLRGRVERARRLAGKKELEFKRSQRAIEYQTKNLALAALEEDSGDS
jgi:hypothetical protein